MDKDPINKLREMSHNGLANEIEAQYMKLPVDADGVPIKIGDKMKIRFDEYAEVIAISGDRWFYIDYDYCADYDYEWAENSYHEEPDTVESVLMEAMQYAFSSGKLDMSDVIGGYAERIRKAVSNG